MAWRGVMLYGLAWHSTAYRSLALRSSAQHGLARHGAAQRGLAQLGPAQPGPPGPFGARLRLPAGKMTCKEEIIIFQVPRCILRNGKLKQMKNY